MIELQSGVAQPAKRPPRQNRKYPFADMNVGDMFFAPRANIASMTSYASTQGRKLGRKFSTRQLWMRETMEGWIEAKAGEDGVTGVGVWRVA